MLSSKLSNSTTLETKNIWKKKRKVDKKEEDIKNLEFDASKEEQIMATTPGILDDSLPDDIINITTTLSNHNNEKQIINKNNLLKLNFNKKNKNSDNIHLIVNVKNKEDKRDINQNEKINNNNNIIINKNYEKSKKFLFLIIIFLSCFIIFIIFCLLYKNFK
jgi:hypothetical protein